MTDTKRIDVDTRQVEVPPGGRHRILVTNDDGIESPGLRRIATALAAEHDVVVAAPAVNMSGMGTGIGRFDDDAGIALERHDVPGVTEAYAIAGPPGLAVMAAFLGAFGDRPDLVVSGVNAGLNTGHSVIHSGTVGAALTAHTFGCRGVAVSLAPSDPWHWETAVPYTVAAAAWVLDRQPRTALNVNIPAVPPDQVRGVRWAELDRFGHFSVATADLEAAELQLDVTDRSSGLDPRSDTALCLDGFVTLTPLDPVEAAPFPDTDAAEVLATSRSGRRD